MTGCNIDPNTGNTMLIRFHIKLFTIIAIISAAGCSTIPVPADRTFAAKAMASRHNWRSSLIRTESTFDVFSFTPEYKPESQVVRIYIEGDGLAWVSRSKPSSNPTPLNPTALKIALNDIHQAVAYLGRPCQYVELKNTQCSEDDWTGGRFSEDVISSMDAAVEQIKGEFRASQVELVGYSGGAAVSLLLAARRNDVDKVITVAGNTDTKAWTDFHKITPLSGSLNPADFIEELNNLKQVHYAGTNDKVVPLQLTKEWVRLFDHKNIELIVKEGYSHSCCWQTLSIPEAK